VLRLEGSHLQVFCGAARYVAFSKTSSHIRSVSVFERHITRLQRLKEPEQSGVRPPVFVLLLGLDFTGGKRFGLHFQIDLGIDVRGVERDVAEPCADRIDVNPGTE
jgi:hypothetical protein